VRGITSSLQTPDAFYIFPPSEILIPINHRRIPDNLDMETSLNASMNHLDPVSPVSPILYTNTSPGPTTPSTFVGSPIKNEDGSMLEPLKKKQKRNKPTLSCEECVERKTKVSYGFVAV